MIASGDYIESDSSVLVNAMAPIRLARTRSVALLPSQQITGPLVQRVQWIRLRYVVCDARVRHTAITHKILRAFFTEAVVVSLVGSVNQKPETRNQKG